MVGDFFPAWLAQDPMRVVCEFLAGRDRSLTRRVTLRSAKRRCAKSQSMCARSGSSVLHLDQVQRTEANPVRLQEAVS